MTFVYQVNPSNVVHDVFDDGEVAVIDLRTGTYFSLNSGAAWLWPLLVSGTTLENLVEVAAKASGGSTESQASVESFVAGLLAEGLIERRDLAPGDTSPSASDAPPSPFEAPLFERFDDLQDLLLLDPIHEVSPTGWPNTPTS